MSKIICKCGNVIPDITDRISFKGRIISDKEHFDLLDFADEMIESSHADRSAPARAFRYGFGGYIKLRDIFQCCECGRILIETQDGDFCFFTPEGHSEMRLLDFEAEEKPEIK